MVQPIPNLTRICPMNQPVVIRIDDLSSTAIRQLLAVHLAQMRSQSPADSVHALDLSGLQQPNVTLFSAWRTNAAGDEELLGCGALKELNVRHAEIKSMRTQVVLRRTGVGQAILQHLIRTALSRGYTRLSLETGSQAAFEPARALYRRNGFVECPPFGDYQPDPNSVFMTRPLGH